MEEKGVRDRKREPEEYNFDYEELADAEVDSEQAGRRDGHRFPGMPARTEIRNGYICSTGKSI